MQVVMLRASRTPKENASRKRKITAISTVSTTGKEKDQPQQVRLFIYFKISVSCFKSFRF
jgi:hypothetical protein